MARCPSFYLVRKVESLLSQVDTHIHHSAAFSKHETLAFVKEMTRYLGTDPVLIVDAEDDGTPKKTLSLQEVSRAENVMVACQGTSMR